MTSGLTASRWLWTAIFVTARATGAATLGGLAGRSGSGPDRAVVYTSSQQPRPRYTL